MVRETKTKWTCYTCGNTVECIEGIIAEADNAREGWIVMERVGKGYGPFSRERRDFCSDRCLAVALVTEGRIRSYIDELMED